MTLHCHCTVTNTEKWCVHVHTLRRKMANKMVRFVIRKYSKITWILMCMNPCQIPKTTRGGLKHVTSLIYWSWVIFLMGKNMVKSLNVSLLRHCILTLCWSVKQEISNLKTSLWLCWTAVTCSVSLWHDLHSWRQEKHPWQTCWFFFFVVCFFSRRHHSSQHRRTHGRQ